MTSPVVEAVEGIDLDHTPPCDAVVNGLRCPAESEYRVTFYCCGSRASFLCERCFTLVQTACSHCLYCDARITDWRLA